MQKFPIKTSKKEQFIDITALIKKAVETKGVQEGICTIFSPHTTAGITLNENCDDTVKGDILFSIDRLCPIYKQFRHLEGNSAAHAKTTLVGNSASLIINDGILQLGQWQGIYFADFDGPRNRELWVKIV